MTGQCLTAVPKGKSSVVNLQLCDEEKREEQREEQREEEEEEEEEGSVAAAAISTTQQWVVTEVMKQKKPAAGIAAAATTAAVGVGKAAGVVAYTIESVAQPGMCVDAAPAGPVAPPCKPPNCTPGAPATASIQV